ncbi:glycosyltransferase [Microbacterium sp. NPDC055910]|uniref:glycosyltransferase n=1 Tax=Microbacterium sp. NPDC055910 TaxID=3345659 RepID=UPI0035DD198D
MTSVRLAYVTQGWSGHDDRFVAAWRAAGAEVGSVSVSRDDVADPRAAVWQDLAALLGEGPVDLVQAGPLTHVVENVRRAWNGPLLGTSWGYDLLQDLERGGAAGASVARSIAASTVLLVDSDPGRAAAAALGFPEDRTMQFPWGVDLERFHPEGADLRDDLGLDRDDVVILSTRRHEPIYSVGTLADALALVADEPRIHAIIAGSGSETVHLRSVVDAAGLADRVRFVGETDNARLADLYRTADLYVSTSTTDGTSISLLEAMASGTPAAVSDIPGNRAWLLADAVEPFALGSASELATRLRAATPRAERAVASCRVRRAVEARADWRETAAGFGALAQRVVRTHEQLEVSR